jgi:hypothetical protein
MPRLIISRVQQAPSRVGPAARPSIRSGSEKICIDAAALHRSLIRRRGHGDGLEKADGRRWPSPV